ncbi:hypothetical protein GCM10011329_17990 [Stakelama pacifica]|nr:hypothetical protein GCM10011329_17990 [Stakelama pacifica]
MTLPPIDPAELQRRAEAVRSRVRLSSIIGIEVKLEQRGAEHLGLCPFHHDTKVGSFTVNDEKAFYHCFACGAHGDVFTYLEVRKGISFMSALRQLESEQGIDFRDAKQQAQFDAEAKRRAREAAEKIEKTRRQAIGIWQSGPELSRDNPAALYLNGRGIDFAVFGKYPGALRYRHDCWNRELRRGIPAMLAQMILPGVGHVATHRTYLEYHRGVWRKAPLDEPKMILGRFTGAHIPLLKGNRSRATLADIPPEVEPFAGEGIENCLSVGMADPGLRIVAAATLENLGALVLGNQTRALTLIHDNDDEVRAFRVRQALARGDEAEAAKHERAAAQIDRTKERVIAKHQEAGRRVRGIWPGPGFKDFNDELRGVRMEDV